jgi:hypothetical protein
VIYKFIYQQMTEISCCRTTSDCFTTGQKKEPFERKPSIPPWAVTSESKQTVISSETAIPISDAKYQQPIDDKPLPNIVRGEEVKYSKPWCYEGDNAVVLVSGEQLPLPGELFPMRFVTMRRKHKQKDKSFWTNFPNFFG